MAQSFGSEILGILPTLYWFENPLCEQYGIVTEQYQIQQGNTWMNNNALRTPLGQFVCVVPCKSLLCNLCFCNLVLYRNIQCSKPSRETQQLAWLKCSSGLGWYLCWPNWCQTRLFQASRSIHSFGDVHSTAVFHMLLFNAIIILFPNK